MELRGKNGFKLFPNGIAHIIRNGISVDGSFHIAMTRHLHVYLCNLDIIPTDMKQTFGRAYELLFQVHASLRLPVNKCDLTEYQNTIDTLFVMLKRICRESSPTDCNSIKFHYPIHWGNTRSELGCAADEKSLKKNCQSLKSGTIVLLMENVASIPKCRCRVSLLLPACCVCVLALASTLPTNP